MLPDSLVLVVAVARLAVAAAPASRAPDSVYLINPEVDAPLLASTAVLWGVVAFSGPSWITPRCPCSTSEVPGFDRGALGNHSQVADTASTVTEGLAVAVPVLVDWFDASSTALAEDLLIDAEALTIAGAAAEIAKYTVQRPRPYVYGATSSAVLHDTTSYLSFFSGHATITFASLSAFSMTQTLRHPSRWWIWLVTGVVGTSVAIERVLAGQHFPSDVVVGSLVGAASGVLVPWFHSVKPLASATLGASRSLDGTMLLVVRGVW